MLTVPGVSSTQRFVTETPRATPRRSRCTRSPVPQTFDDPYYQSVRGMGEWLPLIDRRYYQRNLFDGSRTRSAGWTPAARLLVADRDVKDAALADLGFQWLDLRGE